MGLRRCTAQQLEVPLEELRSADRGVRRVTRPEPGSLLAGRSFDAAPEVLASTFDRAGAIFDDLSAEPIDQLKLIGRRTAHTLNSSLQNVERLKERGAADNPLHMAPIDAERLGLAEGDWARITNTNGSIVARIALDETLRQESSAMTHGFGNAATTGMPHAQRHPGVNVNALCPTGPGSFDPVSTMSQLTGVPVDVRPEPHGRAT